MGENNNLKIDGELMHQRGGLQFNKEGFLLNNSSRIGPDGTTILQVAYISSNTNYEKPTKICSFQNAVNLVLVLAFIIFFVMVEFYGYGFNVTSGFTCMDPALSHQRQKDTISFWILMSGCIVVIPIVYLVLIWFLNKNFTKRGVREILVFYKEYLKGMLLVMTLCEVLKALVVEPRPDFFAVCNPDTASNCIPGKYVETFKCQNFEKYGYRKMFDSTRSFPSGHGAMSVFTTVFCWYIVETRFPTKKLGEGLKFVFLLAALAWGLFCSLTRITDRRHHYWDVLGGIMVGISGGIYSLYVVYQKFDKNIDKNNSGVITKNYQSKNSLTRTIVR